MGGTVSPSMSSPPPSTPTPARSGCRPSTAGFATARPLRGDASSGWRRRSSSSSTLRGPQRATPHGQRGRSVRRRHTGDAGARLPTSERRWTSMIHWLSTRRVPGYSPTGINSATMHCGGSPMRSGRTRVADPLAGALRPWDHHRPRANYGVSPGDVYLERPYLYVGPQAGPPVRDTFWNASFGATVTIDEIRICRPCGGVLPGGPQAATGLIALQIGQHPDR